LCLGALVVLPLYMSYRKGETTKTQRHQDSLVKSQFLCVLVPW
jgi:hypothetical protein